MGKQQKAKVSKGERNADRRNGKAIKNGNRHRGTNLTGIQKVLLGGGALVNIAKGIKQ